MAQKNHPHRWFKVVQNFIGHLKNNLMQDKQKIHPFDIIVGLKNISHLEKLLLFKIYNLDNSNDGCYASDKWFSKLFNVHIKSINRCIAKLEAQNLIIKQHPQNKRKIKVTLPTKQKELKQSTPTLPHRKTEDPHRKTEDPSNSTVTTYQPYSYPPSNPTVDYNTKDTTKDKTKENRESTRPFFFLQTNHPKRLKAWELKYKNQIKHYDKFISNYDDTFRMEKLPFKPDELFNFLCKYAAGYIKNAYKYDK